MTQTSQSRKPFKHIAPSKGWISIDFQELWDYRDLIRLFIWRDIKVRYKQTILGGLWAVIQPLFTMVVFSLIFGRLAKIPSDDIPYPIFSFAALVPWGFFSGTLSRVSGSLVSSAGMLKKIYFPRLTIPIANSLTGFLDFGLSFLVLLVMMLYYGYMPTWDIFWLPLFMLMALATALGIGLWFAAMNVQFRDVGYTLGFILQAWLYITPIAYPSSLLDEPWRTLYGINPMAGVVEGFRWALLGADTQPGPIVSISALVSILFLVSGLFYFRRMERTFADVT